MWVFSIADASYLENRVAQQFSNLYSFRWRDMSEVHINVWPWSALYSNQYKYLVSALHFFAHRFENSFVHEFLSNKSRSALMDFYSWDGQVYKKVLITWKILSSLEYNLNQRSTLNAFFCVFVVVCCRCHLASIETPVDCGFHVINSRWADSHYVKLIGVKGNSMLGERWDNSFCLSLCTRRCFLMCVVVSDNKFIITFKYAVTAWCDLFISFFLLFLRSQF